MNASVHLDIISSLENIKSRGLITDYWVSWVGSGGKLDPKVSSWVAESREVPYVRELLMFQLDDVVPNNNIIVDVDAD